MTKDYAAEFDAVTEQLADRLVSRRSAIRLTGLLALGAPLARSTNTVLATPEPNADATAEADPAADPEAEADPTSEIEGTPPATGDVIIYSGRNENLVGPLLSEFQEMTGINAGVRYGDTAELAATILEEGSNSPADIFFSQDAGALGALEDAGVFTKLATELLDKVEPRFRSDSGAWVGTSGRARVLVYNTDQLSESDLPPGVEGLTGPEWAGKVGWAPTNGSFQAFITAFRQLKGDDAVRAWLVAMKDNGTAAFENNGAITRAVGAGELAAGLVNHYYIYEVQKEEGQTFPIANHFFAGDDPGSLINVAGVGQLASAEHPEEARAFVEFLLSETAQKYFAEETYEYPLADGVPADQALVPLAELQSPDVDLNDLSDLEGTLAMLAEVGVL